MLIQIFYVFQFNKVKYGKEEKIKEEKKIKRRKISTK